MKKTALTLALVSAAGAANAFPAPISGQFSMYYQGGFDTAGVVSNMGTPIASPDTAVNGWVDPQAGTWGVSSTTLFFGLNWTATGGTLYTSSGTYSLNTTTGVVSPVGSCVVANDGNQCFTVGAGQVAGAINFNWGNATNSRVVNVWNVGPSFPISCDPLDPGLCVYSYNLAAVLAPEFESGAFQGFNVVFNFTPVPLPAAVWLLGSGLLGLAGVARRRRK